MTPQVTSGATFGLGVLSSAISGFGKIDSGQQQQAADNYNADITLQNTANKVMVNQQQTSELVGRQAGAYAASGVDIASGSPLLIMIATAARGAQQNEMIEQAGTEEAALQRYYGKIAAFGGTMSGIGSFLNGVSSAASAYTKGTFNPSATPASGGTSGGGSYDSGD
jgi:hypothetical protein